MFDIIDYSEVEDQLLIDLRTKKEFDEFHIPNSINFPILTEKEHAEIGTLYKNKEYKIAKLKAIEFASVKLPKLLKLVSAYNDIVFYCARGGYRSKSVSALFYALDFHVRRLKGGIKSYRNIINNSLNSLINSHDYVTIYGQTGCGKTEILEIIKSMDYPVLDLEKYANHYGSLLGSMGRGKQNSQKMFESLLYHDLLKYKDEKIILIEGESKKIGKISLPESLYNKMISGNKIFIDASMEYRAKRLVDTYGEEIKNSYDKEPFSKLKYYLGNEIFNLIVNKIKENDLTSAAILLCNHHYDKFYKVRPEKDDKIFINEDSKNTAQEIIKFIFN